MDMKTILSAYPDHTNWKPPKFNNTMELWNYFLYKKGTLGDLPAMAVRRHIRLLVNSYGMDLTARGIALAAMNNESFTIGYVRREIERWVRPVT